MFITKFYEVNFSPEITETIDPSLGYEGFYINFYFLQNQYVEFLMHKNYETQDCSIRFWITKTPVGVNPAFSLQNNNNFNLINRPVKYIFSEQVINLPLKDYTNIILKSGNWYINFYNLLNIKNKVKILTKIIDI